MTLYIATPIDGGDLWSARVTLGYSEALRRLSLRMPHEMAPVYYSTDIVRARNRIATYVLNKPPSDDVVLWWDDDVIINDPSIVESMLDVLRRHQNIDVLAACYTSKRDPVRWVHQGCDGKGEYPVADACGFGFTMTTRDCLQRMADVSEIEEDQIDGVDHDVYGIFELLKTPGTKRMRRRSEDYSFGVKWRGLGGSIHMYTQALVGHAGTRVYDARDMG